MINTTIEHVTLPKAIMEKGGEYKIQTTAPSGKALYYRLVIDHGKITKLCPVINNVEVDPIKGNPFSINLHDAQLANLQQLFSAASLDTFFSPPPNTVLRDYVTVIKAKKEETETTEVPATPSSVPDRKPPGGGGGGHLGHIVSNQVGEGGMDDWDDLAFGDQTVIVFVTTCVPKGNTTLCVTCNWEARRTIGPGPTDVSYVLVRRLNCYPGGDPRR